MNITYKFILIFLLFYLFQETTSTCCYSLRKVCENLKDVDEHGDEDWKSLIINPGKCENSEKAPREETMGFNTLKKIPNVTNLYIINIVFKLEDKPFAPLKNNLVYLSIMKNNVSRIQAGIFEDLPKLKKLVLRDSGIVNIDNSAFKDVPKLEVILLSGNKIQTVTIGVLDVLELKNVDLSFNAITTINKNALPQSLIVLNFKKNELTDIQDDTFSNLNSLEMLILSKNKLKVIRKKMFTGLNNLSKLDLSRNEIDTIEDDAFTDLGELMFLYLKYNKLHVLNPQIFLKDMINLTDMEIDQNSLTYLSEELLKKMPNLEDISLNGNPWHCKCLDKLIKILNDREISVSDTEVSQPKCIFVKNEELKCANAA